MNEWLRPYLANINLDFTKNSMLKKPITINEHINYFTYKDEVISYSFVLNYNKWIKFDILKRPIQIEIWAKDPWNELEEK